MIHDAAKNGDAIAIKAFEYTGMMLGFKLADVVAHTNPEAIFLFGGLAQAGDLILTPTIKSFEKNVLNFWRKGIGRQKACRGLRLCCLHARCNSVPCNFWILAPKRGVSQEHVVA